MAKKRASKSMLVIGVGRYGKYLALKLLELGNDVMIIDQDEKVIEELAPVFTDAHIGDCTSETVLEAIGVASFDCCFVTIDENFQASLEITSLLSDIGAKKIVAKASRESQAKFLMKVGANEVVYPEKDNAERLAVKYGTNNVSDYIQISKDYSLVEIPIMKDWVGKSILEIGVRKNYDINVIAVKRDNEFIPSPTPNFVFALGDHVVTLGHSDEVIEIARRLK